MQQFIPQILIIYILILLFLLHKFPKRRVFTIIMIIISLIVIYYDKILQNYRQPRIRNLAKKIIENFNKHEIKYWVDYGTLLGIIREGDIIKHDTDMDICLYPGDPDLSKKLIKVVNDLGPGYSLTYLTRGEDEKTHLFRIFKGDPSSLMSATIPIYSDLYLTKLENDHFVDVSGKLPAKFLGNMKKIDWNGLQVSVPEEIHKTLEWRYGSTYMKSIRFKPNERYLDIFTEEGYDYQE